MHKTGGFMRLRARTDSNQGEMVGLLRQMGASVSLLHQVGGGVPDIVVGVMGISVLAEIKDGRKPPSKQALTEDEIIWHDGWRGAAVILRCDQDAIDLVEKMRIAGRLLLGEGITFSLPQS